MPKCSAAHARKDRTCEGEHHDRSRRNHRQEPPAEKSHRELRQGRGRQVSRSDEHGQDEFGPLETCLCGIHPHFMAFGRNDQVFHLDSEVLMIGVPSMDHE